MWRGAYSRTNRLFKCHACEKPGRVEDDLEHEETAVRQVFSNLGKTPTPLILVNFTPCDICAKFGGLTSLMSLWDNKTLKNSDRLSSKGANKQALTAEYPHLLHLCFQWYSQGLKIIKSDSFTWGSVLLFLTRLLCECSTWCKGLPPVWNPFTGKTNERHQDR